MKTLLASLLAFVAISASAETGDYRFDEIERKVLLEGAQAVKGQQAHGGGKVVTGWFSYARITSDRHRAMFEIFSATQVTLSSETPGEILSLERGRIRAVFDEIMGGERRVVKTPAALLAVHGTDFEVHVDASGETTLDVWEGLVEVRSPLRQEPQFVRAGETSRFGPRRPPHILPMPAHRHRDDGTERPRDDRDGDDGDRGQEPDSGESSRKPRPPRPPES